MQTKFLHISKKKINPWQKLDISKMHFRNKGDCMPCYVLEVLSQTCSKRPYEMTVT